MLRQFLTYNVVGIANTLVGFTIVFGLMFIGVSPIVSNAIGYATGAVLSYYLNSRYTFNTAKPQRKQALKFFAVLGVAYLVNLFTLQILLNFLNPYMAQFVSAIVYTLVAFILAKFFVFKG